MGCIGFMPGHQEVFDLFCSSKRNWVYQEQYGTWIKELFR